MGEVLELVGLESVARKRAGKFSLSMTLHHGITAPALSQPGVLRAIVLTGASLSLTGLFGLGLGTIIRHTAAAITAVTSPRYPAEGAAGLRFPYRAPGQALPVTPA